MRRIAVLGGIAVSLCLMLAWQGGPAFDTLSGLAFGWLAYPARVLPRVTIGWDGVSTGIVCLALFTVGLHRTLVWLCREVQMTGGAPAKDRRSWSPRWTAALVALTVVMFVAGISAAAVVHQAGWLIAARRSLVEEKTRLRNEWGSSIDHLTEIGNAATILMDSPPPSVPPRPDGAALHSWMTEALRGTMFAIGGKLREDLPWNDPRNSAYFRAVVPIFLNPEIRVARSADGYALSHYAGNVHLLGQARASHRLALSDAANTILAGEVTGRLKPWGDPTNLRDPALGVNTLEDGFGGPSGSGANFVFMDGSVRFLHATTSREVLRRLSMATSSDP
jgi:prepilin-type processing-associated H-X9-DG protein